MRSLLRSITPYYYCHCSSSFLLLLFFFHPPPPPPLSFSDFFLKTELSCLCQIGSLGFGSAAICSFLKVRFYFGKFEFSERRPSLFLNFEVAPLFYLWRQTKFWKKVLKKSNLSLKISLFIAKITINQSRAGLFCFFSFQF